LPVKCLRQQDRLETSRDLRVSRGMDIDLDDSGLSCAQKRAALFSRQQGRCAVCGVQARLVADHDHMTGLLRGLLCQPCNVQEGQMSSLLMSADRPDIAAYLLDPPAGREWLWDYPAGWTYADFGRLRQIGGISVLEYVRSYGLLC
jgi:Recombination endonuclease VII